MDLPKFKVAWFAEGSVPSSVAMILILYEAVVSLSNVVFNFNAPDQRGKIELNKYAFQ